MSLSNYDANGVLRQLWDDTTRTYTEYDAQGVQIGDPVDYTPEQNAAADAAATFDTEQSNESLIRERARNALAGNLAAITSLANFEAGTVALTNTQRDQALRQMAGHLGRAFKQLNALIKLELRDLNDTSGTA